MTDRPWRILFQPSFFLPEQWNGIDEYLLLLARHLDRARFELLLLEHDTDGPQTATLAARAGLRLLHAPYGEGAGLPERVGALRGLYRHLGVDVLHLHSPTVGKQVAPALAARLAGIPVTLATYHQVQPWQASLRARALNYAVHRWLVTRTVAVSAGVRETLLARCGLPPATIQVVHNGIDELEPGEGAGVLPEGLPPRRPDEVRLAFVGRLSPEKGVSTLLEAMALLGPQHPEVRLLVAGDGPQRAELEATAARLGVASTVDFLGFRHDARAILRRSDIAVHTPVIEGFGMAVLEAMAVARPVVVNDCPGGIAEIVVPGETGDVVPSGDARALAGALSRLARDPAARERLGRNGQRRFRQRFSAHQMAAQTAALYEASLRDRGRARSA
jgi:glycosyltransferase involved in cell wall biosynthesis